MEGKNRVVNSAEVEPTQEAKPVEVVKSPEEVKPTRPEVKPVESEPEVKPLEAQPEVKPVQPEVKPVESQPEPQPELTQPKSQPEPAKEEATMDALPSSLLPQRSNCKRDREEDTTEQPGKRQRALDTAKQAIKSGVTFMERNSSIFLSVLFLVTTWFASAN